MVLTKLANELSTIHERDKNDLMVFTNVMAWSTGRMEFLVSEIWNNVGEAGLLGGRDQELGFEQF